MDDKSMILFLEKQIYDTIDENDKCFNVTDITTSILNTEFRVGKYYAYLKILRNLDFNEFIKTKNETEQRVEEMMLFIDKIYN